MDIKQTIEDAVFSAFARFRREDDDDQPEGSGKPAGHPVLTLALSAGIDTPDKFTALQQRADKASEQEAEITRLQAVETRVLTEARERATSAAVRAFADKPEKLEKAKKTIGFATDLDDLQNLQAMYEEQTPEPFRPSATGGARQLQSDPPGELPGADDAEYFQKLRETAQKEQDARKPRREK